MSGVMTKTQLAAMLTAWSAALTTPFIRLFTGGVTPTPDSILANFPEPTGTWYAAIAAVFDQVFQHPDGSIEIRTQAPQFNYSGVSPGETITGWALVDTAGPTLLSAGQLDAPVTMGSTLDSLIASPAIIVRPVLAA